MGSSETALEGAPHPAPHRRHVGALALGFGAAGAPLAWAAHLLVNYAFASHACFPGQALRAGPLPGLKDVHTLLVLVDAVTLVVIIAATLIAYRNWRATREEYAHAGTSLAEIGEGRTRFLSLWGLLIGIGFILTVIFDALVLGFVPLCG